MIEKWQQDYGSVMIIALLVPDSSSVLSATVKQSIDSFSFPDPKSIILTPPSPENQTEPVTFSTYTHADGFFDVDLPTHWGQTIETKYQVFIASDPTNTAHLLVIPNGFPYLGQIEDGELVRKDALIEISNNILNSFLFDIGFVGVPEVINTDIQNDQIIVDFNLQIETTQIGQFETIYQGQLTMQWLTEQDPNATIITLARPNSPLLELLEQSKNTFTLNSTAP